MRVRKNKCSGPPRSRTSTGTRTLTESSSKTRATSATAIAVTSVYATSAPTRSLMCTAIGTTASPRAIAATSSSIGELALFCHPTGGFGVRATSEINVGDIVGEYCGRLVVGVQGISQATSGYTLELDTATDNGLTAYVESVSCGSIARFMNHSCDATCVFLELRF